MVGMRSEGMRVYGIDVWRRNGWSGWRSKGVKGGRFLGFVYVMKHF